MKRRRRRGPSKTLKSRTCTPILPGQLWNRGLGIQCYIVSGCCHMNAAPRTRGHSETSINLTMCGLALLTPPSRPMLPMGNRSSSCLVANGSNIAGLLLSVAGRGPCFGSQVITALESLALACVMGLLLHALPISVSSTTGFFSLFLQEYGAISLMCAVVLVT